MLSDIYNARILALAADIPRLGPLPAPEASASKHSKLCGSTVTVDLVTDPATGAVTDFAHDVKACALGQASASIMARHVIGASAAELRQARVAVALGQLEHKLVMHLQQHPHIRQPRSGKRRAHPHHRALDDVGAGALDRRVDGCPLGALPHMLDR